MKFAKTLALAVVASALAASVNALSVAIPDTSENVVSTPFATNLRLDKIDKDLTEEANRKYDFIIERTNEIVGQITDASALRIGDKGDLNGFIKGTRGTAKVETIGAGGYNIQRFHFRTLIKPVK